MKLVGDIGGTKVLLAFADSGGRLHDRRRFSSADFSSFDDLLAAYLATVDLPCPGTGGCLAVAGPVSGDGRYAKITNLPWEMDAARLEARFGLGSLHLINDFAAVAHGIGALAPEHRVCLQAGRPVDAGLRLVVGAGTGLGVAALLGDRVLPSEGGHIGFAPTDAVQMRLHAALLAEHGRVTAERVVSGPGLAALHGILTGETTSAAALGARALAGESAACASVEVFFSCFGAVAGDLALAFMARGGVFLAGGVTQALLPLLPKSGFLAAFRAKAEHAGLVEAMPVHAVAEADIGLLGAARSHAVSSTERYQN